MLMRSEVRQLVMDTCRGLSAALERRRAEVQSAARRLEALSAAEPARASETRALRARLQELFDEYHQACVVLHWHNC